MTSERTSTHPWSRRVRAILNGLLLVVVAVCMAVLAPAGEGATDRASPCDDFGNASRHKKCAESMEIASLVAPDALILVDKDLPGGCPKNGFKGVRNSRSPRVYFYKRLPDGAWALHRSWATRYGCNCGPKRVRGDLKTPEGVYVTTAKRYHEVRDKYYGGRSVLINYPSPHDYHRAWKRAVPVDPGDNISMHGGRARCTEGCVRLQDGEDKPSHHESIEEFVSLLPPADELHVAVVILETTRRECAVPVGAKVAPVVGQAFDQIIAGLASGQYPTEREAFGLLGDVDAAAARGGDDVVITQMLQPLDEVVDVLGAAQDMSRTAAVAPQASPAANLDDDGVVEVPLEPVVQEEPPPVEEEPEPAQDPRGEVQGSREQVVYFVFDSDEVDNGARQVLARLAASARRVDGAEVEVEGHCDERGPHAYNDALGRERAERVMQILVDEGVAMDRIEVTSYGERLPASLGHDEDAWAANRRVVIRIGEALVAANAESAGRAGH